MQLVALLLTTGPHDTAAQFQWLWRIYLVVLGVVAVLVVSAIVWSVLRYRRRPGRAPSQIASAPRLEAVYVSAIALIVIGLITLTLRTENQVDSLAGHPAVRIDVTAFQWQWSFRYPRSGVSIEGRNVGSAHPSYALLVVPAARPVQFTLRSADVLHSFFIPALRFKRYAFPNYTNRFVLTFPHPGRLLGQCAQFCGWDHAEMRFTVLVLPDARFRAWLAHHQRGAVT